MTNDNLGDGLIRTCIIQGSKVYCKRTEYDIFASEYISKSHHWMIKTILLRQLKSFGWISNVDEYSVVIMSDVSFNKKFKK
jgi:hypothetical protein